MKSRPSLQTRANQGNALMIMMCTVGVLGIALASVLALVAQEHRIIARTSAWNAALPAAEAGVEEAMSHLHNVGEGNRAANGWSQSGSSFVKKGELDDGRYYVTAISSDTPPVIVSAGYAWCSSADRFIERRIQLQTRAKGRGLKGMTAKSKVVVGGDAYTDSYDSTDPNKSTNGLYDPAKRQSNGHISSNSKSSSDVEIKDNARINGKIATGPGSVLKLASPARVGDFAWTASSANNGKVQPGWLSADMNVSFPDVVMPTGAGFLSPPPAVSGTRTLLSGNYVFNPDLKLSDGQKLVVAGDVTIFVKDTFDMSGTSQLIIAPGAKLNLYVQKSTAISGDGIINSTGIPANFNYYGSKENYQIYYSGKSAFIGTVYAPSAKMDLTGDSHFMGASVSNEIVLGGKFQFHYDESLGGGDGGDFVLAYWKEI